MERNSPNKKLQHSDSPQSTPFTKKLDISEFEHKVECMGGKLRYHIGREDN